MKTKSSKIAILMMTLAIFVFSGSYIIAQDLDKGAGNCVRDFIDEDGDGFNDLAPDHDGDGIPNGQDDDYNPPLDGAGNQFGDGGNKGDMTQVRAGIRNTIMECKDQSDTEQGQMPHNGFGPGDGTGNADDKPEDGTGNGQQKGNCTEDGPVRIGR